MRSITSKILSLLLTTALLSAAALVAQGCSEDDAGAAPPRVDVAQTDDGGQEAYGGADDKAVVVSGSDTYVVTGDPGNECVELDNGDCVDLTEAKGRYCDEPGAQADVVVIDGEVVEVICYPDDDGGTPIEEVTRDGAGNGEIPQNQSGTVITFDESTDGEPFEGSLNLEAERTTLYGNGVGDTIIDGDLTVSSNNSRVRGVTVTGNLKIDKVSNNAALAFCEIQKDLKVEGNGVTVVNCQVFGNVDVTGNGCTLLNVGVGGQWNVNDKTTCDGCYSFDDANDDFVVGDDELGDDLTCDGVLIDG